MILVSRKMFIDPPYFIALILIADLCFGDPVYAWHPIRLLGLLMQKLEAGLRKVGLDGRFGGFLLFVFLVAIVFLLVGGIDHVLARVDVALSWLWQIFLGWNTIALKDLCIHGLRIKRAVAAGDLEKARFHVSMLTGRDTDKMDLPACNRAAVESLSESLVDGIVSPLFYIALFGIEGGIIFKIVSTMDSMVGYKNEKYLYFGWFGARTDDVMNYLPARLTYLMIALVASLTPGLSGRKTLQVGWSQHSPIPGPNAGWSEAATAGAIQRRIVGPIWRNMTLVTEIWIGDPQDEECGSSRDVDVTIYLLYIVTFLFSMAAIASWELAYLPVQWWI